jgi:hypothetical protein
MSPGTSFLATHAHHLPRQSFFRFLSKLLAVFPALHTLEATASGGPTNETELKALLVNEPLMYCFLEILKESSALVIKVDELRFFRKTREDTFVYDFFR